MVYFKLQYFISDSNLAKIEKLCTVISMQKEESWILWFYEAYKN